MGENFYGLRERVSSLTATVLPGCLQLPELRRTQSLQDRTGVVDLRPGGIAGPHSACAFLASLQDMRHDDCTHM